MKPGKMLCSDVSHAGYTLFIACVNLASSRMSKLESLIREDFFYFFPCRLLCIHQLYYFDY